MSYYHYLYNFILYPFNIFIIYTIIYIYYCNSNIRNFLNDKFSIFKKIFNSDSNLTPNNIKEKSKYNIVNKSSNTEGNKSNNTKSNSSSNNEGISSNNTKLENILKRRIGKLKDTNRTIFIVLIIVISLGYIIINYIKLFGMNKRNVSDNLKCIYNPEKENKYRKILKEQGENDDKINQEIRNKEEECNNLLKNQYSDKDACHECISHSDNNKNYICELTEIDNPNVSIKGDIKDSGDYDKFQEKCKTYPHKKALIDENKNKSRVLYFYNNFDIFIILIATITLLIQNKDRIILLIVILSIVFCIIGAFLFFIIYKTKNDDDYNDNLIFNIILFVILGIISISNTIFIIFLDKDLKNKS